MITGKIIKWFPAPRGYGFIEVDAVFGIDANIFAHIVALVPNYKPRVGDRVGFFLGERGGRSWAQAVRPLVEAERG